MKVHVALGSSDDPLRLLGSLLSGSPIEPLRAPRFQVETDIGAVIPDEHLRIWRAAMMKATLCFDVIENNENRFWRSLQIRDNIAELGAVVTRSQVGRAREVMQVALMLHLDLNAKMSVASNVAAWMENMNTKRARLWRTWPARGSSAQCSPAGPGPCRLTLVSSWCNQRNRI